MNLERHDIDVVALLFGLLFAAVAVGTLTRDVWLWDAFDLGPWTAPVILIGLGLLGLALSLRPQREPDDVSPSRDGG